MTAYYMRVDGTAANKAAATGPGTSQSACMDVSVHNGETFSAGDIIYLCDDGGSFTSRIVVPSSGSSGSLITYDAESGDTPIVDGTGVNIPQWYNGLFDIIGKTYVKVQNLKVQDSEGPAIAVDSGANYCEVRDNVLFRNVSSGVLCRQSDNVIIDGNELDDCCNGQPSQEGISVITCDDVVVSNNHLHDFAPPGLGGEGIDFKVGCNRGKAFGNHVHDLDDIGIYCDAFDTDQSDIEFYNNLIHDIVGGAGIRAASEQGGALSNVRVHHNIIYNVGGTGIELGHHATATTDSIYFQNNTIYNVGYDAAFIFQAGILQTNLQATNVFIRNNIVRDATAGSIVLWRTGTGATNATVDSNVVDTFGSNTGEVLGDNSIEADPLFVSAAGGDFHLQGTSPAIDAGIAL